MDDPGADISAASPESISLRVGVKEECPSCEPPSIIATPARHRTLASVLGAGRIQNSQREEEQLMAKGENSQERLVEFVLKVLALCGHFTQKRSFPKDS